MVALAVATPLPNKPASRSAFVDGALTETPPPRLSESKSSPRLPMRLLDLGPSENLDAAAGVVIKEVTWRS